MTQLLRKGMTNGLLLLLSFLLSAWVYSHFLIAYAHYISSYGMDFAVALDVIIVLILTYFTFILLHLAYTRQITSKTLIVSYFIYGLVLVYVLFLKHIGTQGFSFNPLSFISDYSNGSRFVPIMNLLMFIPLGCLFRFSKSNLLLCLLGLLTVESCQYVFRLGIFDLGDVTLNLLSLMIGNFLHQAFWEKWLSRHLITA